MPFDSRRIKNHLKFLVKTPLHPQWLIYGANKAFKNWLRNRVSGRILDIGCADGAISSHLPNATGYIGLDYPSTAIGWYKTKPTIFGNAVCLPFADNSFDTVLLLDVLEHIPSPQQACAEAVRVLRTGGKLVIKTPFLYPLHDAPLDFTRWTVFGLERIIRNFASMEVEELNSWGYPVETSFLLFNIAMAKTGLDLLANKSPLLLLLLPLALPAILFANLAAVMLRPLGRDTKCMPFAISLIATKK